MTRHEKFPASAPLAGTASAPSVPLNGVGATLPQVTCHECNGSGECEFIALDSTRYETGYCEECQGTGVVDARCLTCEGPLTFTGFCMSCSDFGSSGWALAERSAYGMTGGRL